ncbi:hypothetical protein STAQ_07830 [Allostella sp. ATCC 35155]|nr:hypothetical protein STAQ_07830 [Stella sp. ATCC 35155]
MTAEPAAALVRTAPTLAAEDLAALSDGRLIALRIPHFAAADTCRRLVPRILASPQLGSYGNIRSARRLGMVFYETLSGPAARAAYFGTADESIRAVRDIFGPGLSPIDRLRLELDEIWPGGALRARMAGGAMFVGTLRAFDGRSEVEPHVDFLPDDEAQEAWCRALTGQLAANIYLQPAETGGELEIWDFRPDIDWQDRMAVPGGYGFARSALPPPTLRLAPRTGELILFDSRCVHSVAPVAGARLSLSCFIGCAGPDQPLHLWS